MAVESISRFARNARDLLGLVEKLTQKGVEFISLKEHIDTTTPTGAAQKLRPQPVNAKIFHAHTLRPTGRKVITPTQIFYALHLANHGQQGNRTSGKIFTQSPTVMRENLHSGNAAQ